MPSLANTALVLIALAGCSKSEPKISAQSTASMKQAAKAAGLQMPFNRVYLRAFKQEKELEFWAADKDDYRFTLVKTYRIAAASGKLGPKRREGDLQVPEGFYRIDRFNPNSQFHLSLGLNYPNASDRIRGDKKRPGSDIFIHGNQVSIGCMAMTDPMIDEIYLACEKAGNRRSISVHVFPARLSAEKLAEIIRSMPGHAAFWKELKPVYDSFEKTKIVPRVTISRVGEYSLAKS